MPEGVGVPNGFSPNQYSEYIVKRNINPVSQQALYHPSGAFDHLVFAAAAADSDAPPVGVVLIVLHGRVACCRSSSCLQGSC
jgi:hypothetical protein